jgi:hypothetical protein
VRSGSCTGFAVAGSGFLVGMQQHMVNCILRLVRRGIQTVNRVTAAPAG